MRNCQNNNNQIINLCIILNNNVNYNKNLITLIKITITHYKISTI